LIIQAAIAFFIAAAGSGFLADQFGYSSPPRLEQGEQNKDYTYQRYGRPGTCDPSHPFCPDRHIFLGTKIAICAFVLAIAVWIGVLSIMKIGAKGVDIMLDKPILGWTLIIGCGLPGLIGSYAFSSVMIWVLQWP